MALEIMNAIIKELEQIVNNQKLKLLLKTLVQTGLKLKI